MTFRFPLPEECDFIYRTNLEDVHCPTGLPVVKDITYIWDCSRKRICGVWISKVELARYLGISDNVLRYRMSYTSNAYPFDGFMFKTAELCDK